MGDKMRIELYEIILIQICGISAFFFYELLLKKNRTGIEWKNCIYYMYFAGMITILLVPRSYPGMPHSSEDIWRNINLQPFAYVAKSLSQLGEAYSGDILFHLKLIAKNVVGNIVIFVPFGFFIRMKVTRVNSLGAAALYGLLVSLTIELIQLLQIYLGLSIRTFDIDDIILNTIGVVLGYLLISIMKTKYEERRARLA